MGIKNNLLSRLLKAWISSNQGKKISVLLSFEEIKKNHYKEPLKD